MVELRREVDFGAASSGIEGTTLTVKGPKGSVSRSFASPFVTVSLTGGKAVFEARRDNRKARAVMETFAAHAANMAIGASEGFTYRLEIVQSHFPSKVTSSGETVKIENFTGEKSPRTIKLEKGVKIRIEGKDVFLSGADIEALAKTAQKLEDVTKIRRKDHRTFQDGIYIMEKKIRGGVQ